MGARAQRFNVLFEAMVMTLADQSRMPVRQIAVLLKVSVARLWRALGALVDAAYATVDMAGVEALDIDEKRIGRGRVVTVVHDGSAAIRNPVLHLSEGCKVGNVGIFVATLKAKSGVPGAVPCCSMDMAKIYIADVARFFRRHFRASTRSTCISVLTAETIVTALAIHTMSRR